MGKRKNLEITTTNTGTEKKEIQRLIRRYRTRQYKKMHFREALRNRIYLLMQSKIQGYIKGVLHRWHRYEDETVIISLSWDSFLFCIDRYVDEKYDVYGHFNMYTRYFLLLYYAEVDKPSDVLYLEDIKEVVLPQSMYSEDERINALDKLLELKKFRDSIVQKHQQMVFDHMVMGDHPELFANLKKDRGGTSCYQYYRGFGMSAAFKSIIDYILKGDKT